jgi:hypothetical protein
MVKKQVPAFFQGRLMAFTAVKQQFGQIKENQRLQESGPAPPSIFQATVDG